VPRERPMVSRATLRGGLLSAACALAVTALACADATPGLAPPGLDGKPIRLFFPTGIAVSGTSLYVANSNFDRAFNSGTLVRLSTSVFPPAPAVPPLLPPLITPAAADEQVAFLDSYAGELRLNPAGTSLYVATGDHDLLNRISLTPATGEFNCPTTGTTGCSTNAVKLLPQNLSDPFAIAFATSSTGDPQVLVSHLSPESTGTTNAAKDAFLAVLPEAVISDAAAPTTPVPADPFSTGAFRIDIGTVASSAVIVDPVTNVAYVGGCFIRVSVNQVLPCGLDQDTTLVRQNLLRIVQPRDGANAPVQQVSLGTILGGGDTTALALSSDGKLLYVATSRPSALVTIVLPAPGTTSPPVLRSAVPLATSPGQLLVVPGPHGDLVVASATASDALLIVDPLASVVLKQIRPIGLGPYGLALAPADPASPNDRVFVGLFRGCAVAAVDIPKDAPFNAFVSSTVGACQ
jgi:DNA-binding beta-propeller fold protein YncE